MDGLNKKRFFAFGCSYTGYATGTWADFIGANFEEYYNFGRGGVCNTFILDKVIEADIRFKFNAETDYIVVMFSSFDRFSFYNTTGWKGPGNIWGNDHPKEFVEKMWSDDWGIYNSWIAINIIKQLLTLKKIEHKFLLATDNSFFLKDNNANELLHRPDLSIIHINEFYALLDNKQAVWDWQNEHYTYPTDYHTYADGYIDSHPTQEMHYAYAKQYFPHFDTDLMRDRFEYAQSITDFSSFSSMGGSINKNIDAKYNKVYNSGVF